MDKAEKEKSLLLKEQDLITKLYPPFGNDLGGFMRFVRSKGLNIYLFEGLRTYEEQKEKYLVGRDPNTLNVLGAVLTNAKPGASFHQYGLAGDAVFVDEKFNWTWGESLPWKEFADLAVANGFESAFYWKTFKEGPHIQKRYGCTTIELLKVLQDNNDDLKSVWNYIDKKRSV